MLDLWHGRFGPANFGRNLRYAAAAKMFFPAAIPLVAVVALIAWSTREEARAHGNSSGSKKT